MTSPQKPPTRPREPRNRRDLVTDIDTALTVLTRSGQHHTDPRAEARVNELLDQRNQITREEQP